MEIQAHRHLEARPSGDGLYKQGDKVGTDSSLHGFRKNQPCEPLKMCNSSAFECVCGICVCMCLCMHMCLYVVYVYVCVCVCTCVWEPESSVRYLLLLSTLFGTWHLLTVQTSCPSVSASPEHANVSRFCFKTWPELRFSCFHAKPFTN